MFIFATSSWSNVAKGAQMTQSKGLGADIALDHELSPYTGLTRAHLAALADHMLLAVRKYASPGHGRVTPPGAPGGYGHDVDGLEGFARTFLLAGFRLAGEADDPLGLAQWYADGIAEGTDPGSPYRWVRCDEHPQAKVEAASLAIVLDMTRPLIWDRLSDAVRQRVVEYLAPVVGDNTYPPNNWLWFRICVETFLRSVGGPWSADDIAADLARHDSFRRAGGWLSDGEERAFDHYSGWALSLYPTLWQRMTGAHDLADDARRAADLAALDGYLGDAVALVGADGGPLIQGRSLIYRFASAAPFWAGAIAGVPSLSPGLLRRAAVGIVQHFAGARPATSGEDCAPDGDGLLSMGWFGPCRELAQSYSGPGSPYWASKGLLGLALPSGHAVWTSREDPLPVERGDFVRAMAAPGWVVSGTQTDGIVRLVNHGTDHANPGDTVGDSPLYAMLGYSTATAPLVDDGAYRQPLAQYVALTDADGRRTHRAGFETLGCGVDDGVAWAASRQSAHWLELPEDQVHHGSGYAGAPTIAGVVTVVSLLRGPWECRLARVDELFTHDVELRVAGWPLSQATASVDETRWTARAVGGGGGFQPAQGSQAPSSPHSSLRGYPGQAAAVSPALTGVPPATAIGASAIAAVVGDGLVGPSCVGVGVLSNANPLGTPSSVPYLVFPATCGEWSASLLTLSGAGQPVICRRAVIEPAVGGWQIAVTWPDGQSTSTAVDNPGTGTTQPVTASPANPGGACSKGTE